MAESGREHAIALDNADPLKHTRAEFVVPTTADILTTTLKDSTQGMHEPPSSNTAQY